MANICQPPDVFEQALKLLQTKQADQLDSLLTANPDLLQHIYPQPHYKNLLQIACCDLLAPACVRVLLQHGADPNFVDDRFQRTPLHFAVEKANEEIVEMLLQHPDVDPNAAPDGRTPLGLLVQAAGKSEEDLLGCAKLLLAHPQTDAGRPDAQGKPPAYFAAKKKLRKLLELIVTSHTRDSNRLDLDSFRDLRGKSTRDLILDYKLLPDHLLPGVSTRVKSPKERLFHLIQARKEEEFLGLLGANQDLANASEGPATLLQAASEANLPRAVAALLGYGAEPHPALGDRPIKMACQMGHVEVVRQLLPVEADDLSQYLLLAVKSNKMECFDLLLEQPGLDINHRDYLGNTALHYASNKRAEFAEKLLARGASLGCQNRLGVLSIMDLSPQALENHLDSCVEYEAEESLDDEKFTVTFRYASLLPPDAAKAASESAEDPEDPCLPRPDGLLAPEMDSLLQMSRSTQLRHLLKHPLATSFLYFKWHQVRWLFYLNVLSYVIFWMALLAYILLGYLQPPLVQAEAAAALSYAVLIFTFLLLLARELFQAVVFGSKYFADFVNYFEICVLLVTAMILCLQTAARKELSSVAILSSSVVLILLIGQHPSLSTNVCMFRTVSWNFLKLLSWYFILILAFALSFFILFRDLPTNSTDCGDQAQFFSHPGESLFKTIVMLTGEFDANSIQFETLPGISHFIFVLFVFTIAIVLFNLLNGLAISDTQQIKEEAELHGHLARVRFLADAERILLSRRLLCTIPMALFAPRFLLRRTAVTVQLSDGRVVQNEGKGRIFNIRGLDGKNIKTTRSLVKDQMNRSCEKDKDQEFRQQIEEMRKLLQQLCSK